MKVRVHGSKNTTFSATLSLVLLLVGIALLNGAKWVMLDGATAIPMGVTWASRFAGIITFVLFIVLYRDHIPQESLLRGILIALMSAYVLALLLLRVISDDMLTTVVLYVSNSLYGVADALFILLYAHALTRYKPLKAVILFGLMQALSNAFMVVFSALDARSVFVVRTTAIVCGTALVVIFGTVIQRNSGKSGYPEARDSAELSKAARLTKAVFPSTALEWAAFLAAVCLFNLIFGVIAQVNSSEGGSFGLYDVYTGIIVVVLDVLVVLFVRISSRGTSFTVVVVIVSMLFVSGLLLYVGAWSGNNLLAGVLVRCGYNWSFILLAGIMAHKCYLEPQKTYLFSGTYFCLHIGLVYVGRIIGAALVTNSTSQTVLLANISQVLLWVLFALGALAFLLVATKGTATRAASASLFVDPAVLEHAEEQLEGDYAAQLSAGEVSGGAFSVNGNSVSAPAMPGVAAGAADDAPDARERAFKDFCSSIELTQREEDVMAELIRGYNRAAIAKRLYLSPETVKSHISRIYQKAGVNSRQELLELAEQKHLI